MGGVNHCRSHCRSAKFRGLVYEGKYSAVIDFTITHSLNFILGIKQGVFRPITALYFLSYFKPNHGMSPNDSVSDSG